MTHEDKALEIFRERVNCAQAVLGAFAAELGLSPEQAMGIALCFGGGMRKGGVCGAVTGAMMALGMTFDQTGKTPDEVKAAAYPRAAEFMECFQKENGTYICKELLGCDISTGRGMKYAREHDLFATVCPRWIASAVKILEEMGV